MTDNQTGYERILSSIDDGSGLRIFEQMVEAQGGSLNSLHNLEISSKTIEVVADSASYVESMNALSFGNGAMKLGAGRARKEDEVDVTVGLVIHRRWETLLTLVSPMYDSL